MVNFGLTFGLGHQWSIPNNHPRSEGIPPRQHLPEILDKVKPFIAFTHNDGSGHRTDGHTWGPAFPIITLRRSSSE